GAEPLLVSHYESSFAAAASALSAVSFLADEAFLAAGLRLSIFTSSTSSLVSSERCPRRRRYPFFGRYLKTRSFSPRRCSVTFASTFTFSRSDPVTTASSPRNITARRLTLSPSPTGRRSTTSTVPFSARYCLPPVSTIAYAGVSVFAISRCLSPFPAGSRASGRDHLGGHGAGARSGTILAARPPHSRSRPRAGRYRPAMPAPSPWRPPRCARAGAR